MSIRSLYSSGDDEEELFRLTAPDEHPDSSDESIAILEEESLSSSNYDDAQDELDEHASPINLEGPLRELSDDELAEVVRLIEEIQNRRESDGHS
jgi:hypothetical protein